MRSTLILASQSPRRAELLRQLGVEFTVRPAHLDETQRVHEPPEKYVQRMALEKAGAVAAALTKDRIADCGDIAEYCVLGADTTVIVDGHSLGKPADAADAKAMLTRLGGRAHSVVTAICLIGSAGRRVCCVETVVEFCELSSSTLDAYIHSGEPFDKAGAYAIQGLAGAFVMRIEGSYSNVVGLPLLETRGLLEEAGVATGLDRELAA